MKYQYVKAPKPRDNTVEEGVGTGTLDFKTIARAIPCQEACPAKTNVPLYIEYIAQGRHDDAYRVNLEDNVFPGVLGRVCTRVCEQYCRHNWTNIHGPVQICHLKRAAADRIRTVEPPSPYFGPSGKRVLVVGAGPAGLACARELARMGHRVEVRERNPQPGGMLTYGIPAFRLPRDVVQAEIDLIARGGVRIACGAPVTGQDVEAALSEYDAVVVATGTAVSNTLEIPGSEAVQTYVGLSFMAGFNSGELTALTGDTVVVGGGFTAVDCARAARRISAPDARISIVYRRTEASMSADQGEFAAMEEEAIAVRTLLHPVAVESTPDGPVLVCQRNRIAGSHRDAKPRVEPIADLTVRIPCNNLVLAIGQRTDDTLLPQGVTRADTGYGTTTAGLFVAGDFHGASADVVSAVASGKDAAVAVDTYLSGRRRIVPQVRVTRLDRDGDTGRVRDHDIQFPLPMPAAHGSFPPPRDTEVETGFSDAQTQVAATRCYLCHYKFEIDADVCIHCDWCIQAAPRDCIKKVRKVFTDSDGFVTGYLEAELSREATFIYIDNDACIRCGKCLRVCPVEAISMKQLALCTGTCDQ